MLNLYITLVINQLENRKTVNKMNQDGNGVKALVTEIKKKTEIQGTRCERDQAASLEKFNRAMLWLGFD